MDWLRAFHGLIPLVKENIGNPGPSVKSGIIALVGRGWGGVFVCLPAMAEYVVGNSRWIGIKK
jgi:hypothetical protein